MRYSGLSLIVEREGFKLAQPLDRLDLCTALVWVEKSMDPEPRGESVWYVGTVA